MPKFTDLIPFKVYINFHKKGLKHSKGKFEVPAKLLICPLPEGNTFKKIVWRKSKIGSLKEQGIIMYCHYEQLMESIKRIIRGNLLNASYHAIVAYKQM